MKEIWKDIEGYEGLYQVSNEGCVKNVKTNKVVSTFCNHGYLRVNLTRNQKTKKFLVHRLVAETFIPNLENLAQVNHKDENKKNNKVSNLEWVTQEYNIQYSRCVPIVQYDLEGNFIGSYKGIAEANRNTNINCAHIIQCCKGTRNTAGGYTWKYKDAI